MDTGNAAWMLMAATLVFVMTPGIALFYGGMVRAKSVLNMLMLSAGALAVTAIVWTLWGWSIAFAGDDIGGIFGDPAKGFLLKDAIVSNNGVFTAADSSGNYPANINIAFQAALAMFAVALISGALAERIRYSSWMLFVVLWITFVYAPLAHMTWNGGLLSATGAISQAIGAPIRDFAGGSVIQVNAAIAALVIVLVIGTRKDFGKQLPRPHNVPLVLIGAFLLWFGWFGFTGGSALAANGTAGYVWMSTAISGAAGMLAWGFTEKIRSGHYTAVGAASGIISGLAAITPGANVVSPLWALVIGAIAGLLACLACGMKNRFGYDDSLDVVAVQGVSALLGIVLVGVFAEGTGLVFGGWRQLLAQVCLAVVTLLYSGALTALIAFVLEKTIGWRVSDADELRGMDLIDQGEQAYDFARLPSLLLAGNRDDSVPGEAASLQVELDDFRLASPSLSDDSKQADESAQTVDSVESWSGEAQEDSKSAQQSDTQSVKDDENPKEDQQ
ncbi:ammonium transporter [Bifidobacterium aemilianum]|uniref:Ammonium transporter n=1 Tax=Bifidobacterium aemilianum TaxID=2493120 RepID=A0A366K814_9BIFI|nr:ammonium transporter [Bifidobacterium aemilianum]